MIWVWTYNVIIVAVAK